VSDKRYARQSTAPFGGLTTLVNSVTVRTVDGTVDRRTTRDAAPTTPLDRIVGWTTANAAPLLLLPLAALLLWVAIWRIWLPRPSGGVIDRTVTTVNASAAVRPRHRVTTVVRTAGATGPPRRSETLVIALVFLAVGIAVVGLFHDRIASIELDRDGFKIVLTKPEKEGAAELVERLARSGAGGRTYARALQRYLRAVAARRPAVAPTADAAVDPGLPAAEALALARAIADELT
jgi:hypothetical protein